MAGHSSAWYSKNRGCLGDKKLIKSRQIGKSVFPHLHRKTSQWSKTRIGEGNVPKKPEG